MRNLFLSPDEILLQVDELMQEYMRSVPGYDPEPHERLCGLSVHIGIIPDELAEQLRKKIHDEEAQEIEENDLEPDEPEENEEAEDSGASEINWDTWRQAYRRGTARAIWKLMHKLYYPFDTAMDILEIPEDQREEYRDRVRMEQMIDLGTDEAKKWGLV